MVMSFLKMAMVICIPMVLVIGTYQLKVAMTMTVVFAMMFVDFWFQLARYIDSTILDAFYGSITAPFVRPSHGTEYGDSRCNIELRDGGNVRYIAHAVDNCYRLGRDKRRLCLKLEQTLLKREQGQTLLRQV